MAREIEAIIFDKDGTLFDFRATWGTWAESMIASLAGGDTDLRGRVSDALGYVTGRGFESSSVVIAGTPGQIAAALSKSTGLPPEDLEALANRIAEVTPQVSVTGLVEIISGLAEDHVLGVVTNDGEAPALVHLEGAGLAPHLAFVSGYDSGHGAKPEPGPLLAFSRATGTRPEHTLMVGDSRHDMAAGRAAGMGTVAVLTGTALAEDLADLADAVLPDISHLAGWIAAGR